MRWWPATPWKKGATRPDLLQLARFWQRYRKPPLEACPAQLARDFIGQIPRQDQDHIRRHAEQRVRLQTKRAHGAATEDGAGDGGAQHKGHAASRQKL